MPYVGHGCTTFHCIWDSTGSRVQFRSRISQGTSVSASETWRNSGWSVLSRNDRRTLTKFGNPQTNCPTSWRDSSLYAEHVRSWSHRSWRHDATSYWPAVRHCSQIAGAVEVLRMEHHEAGSSSRCQATLLLVQKPEVHHLVSKRQLLLFDVSHKRSLFLKRTFVTSSKFMRLPTWYLPFRLNGRRRFCISNQPTHSSPFRSIWASSPN